MPKNMLGNKGKGKLKALPKQPLPVKRVPEAQLQLEESEESGEEGDMRDAIRSPMSGDHSEQDPSYEPNEEEEEESEEDEEEEEEEEEEKKEEEEEKGGWLSCLVALSPLH